MGRFDFLTTAIRFVFDALGVTPRPWMAAVALVVLGLTLGPSMHRSLSTTRARKLVLGLADLDPAARQARSQQILSLVERNPDGLIAIADEALRRRQEPLAREAYRLLRNSGKRPREQLRLEEALNGPLPRHVEEEVAAVERLLESGALARAEQRLERARGAFPRDERLADLRRRLDEARLRA
ncbi:hypothetical protein L6R53_21240 [Myxococcota bacterium]|nr:hypothetical protein [Myxococcota bacterium]